MRLFPVLFFLFFPTLFLFLLRCSGFSLNWTYQASSEKCLCCCCCCSLPPQQLPSPSPTTKIALTCSRPIRVLSNTHTQKKKADSFSTCIPFREPLRSCFFRKRRYLADLFFFQLFFCLAFRRNRRSVPFIYGLRGFYSFSCWSTGCYCCCFLSFLCFTSIFL